MSAGQESGSPIRENRTLLPAPLPPDEARGTLAAAAGVSTVGLRPPFDTPQRHSHPVCRAILTLIVALEPRAERWSRRHKRPSHRRAGWGDCERRTLCAVPRREGSQVRSRRIAGSRRDRNRASRTRRLPVSVPLGSFVQLTLDGLLKKGFPSHRTEAAQAAPCGAAARVFRAGCAWRSAKLGTSRRRAWRSFRAPDPRLR